jgi:hypothetical protein
LGLWQTLLAAAPRLPPRFRAASLCLKHTAQLAPNAPPCSTRPFCPQGRSAAGVDTPLTAIAKLRQDAAAAAAAASAPAPAPALASRVADQGPQRPPDVHVSDASTLMGGGTRPHHQDHGHHASAPLRVPLFAPEDKSVGDWLRRYFEEMVGVWVMGKGQGVERLPCIGH